MTFYVDETEERPLRGGNGNAAAGGNRRRFDKKAPIREKRQGSNGILG